MERIIYHFLEHFKRNISIFRKVTFFILQKGYIFYFQSLSFGISYQALLSFKVNLSAIFCLKAP